MRGYINMKETRIFASPFGMVEQTKEERLQWAEDNGMVWSVTWFLSSINCDMINTDTYQFDSYETESEDAYQIYLFLQLIQCFNKDFAELPYDIQFEEGCELLKEYENSIYNNDNKSEYDCMVEFLNDKYKHLHE